MKQANDPIPTETELPADTPAIARAREYGIDITLLNSMLNRTVEERLQALDADLRFFHSIRILHEGS